MSNLGDGMGPGVLPHDSDACPFCPVDAAPRDLTSKIGKDNKSGTLGTNLEAAADPKADHLYFDVDFDLYRNYSAEAHHLICGNEVLKEEAELEKYLVAQGKKTSKGAAGLLKPNDVGYDINHAKNGIWLPSVPDLFRRTKGRRPDRWWGDQKAWNAKRPAKTPPRMSLDEWERFDAAFIVMEAVKLQFHKGEHGAVGEPHNNYVREGIRRVRELTVTCQTYSTECPMKKGEPTKKPPFVPPYKLIRMLNSVSKGLSRELKGPPESWKFFISEYALRCSNFWVKEMRR